MAKDDGIALPLVWIDPDSIEIQFVNQLVVQHQGDEYILTFGQQSPPMLMGTLEERKGQAEKIPYVPIRTAVRLGTTTKKMREFVNVLGRFLEQQEKAEGQPE